MTSGVPKIRLSPTLPPGAVFEGGLLPNRMLKADLVAIGVV